MLVNAVEIPDSTIIDSDVCIIGAGAAGITLASRLDGTNLRVTVLEGGGLDPDQSRQIQYEGFNVGRNYYDLKACRLRYLGGTTNHWAGWCRPLAASDFLPKPWVPFSGWPIGLHDVIPYYPSASEACELGPFDFAPTILERDSPSGTLPPWNPRKIIIEPYRFSPPTRFGRTYLGQLQRSKNISLYLDANATMLETNEPRTRVTAISVRGSSGNGFKVRSPIYALAAGGIENARMLLHSRVGNDHDLVGRFFMDHPEPEGGLILTLDPNDTRWRPLVYDLPGRLDLQPFGSIKISDELQKTDEIVGCAFGLTYSPALRSDGWMALRNLPEDLATEKINGMGRDLWAALTDAGGIAGNLKLKVSGRDLPLMVFGVHCFGQQSPNPHSRLTLSDERDRFGIPKPVLNWQLTELDRRSIRRSLEILGEELGSLGLGRLRIDFNKFPDEFYYGHHHIGTTRMSDSSTTGVVDPDCKVHGVENLFVAGSSVFPTCGTSPPTLTIVALAMRLADHLKVAF